MPHDDDARDGAPSAGATPLAVYIQEMFTTGHDEANRAAVAAVPAACLNLAGIGLRGPRNAVDRVVKGARMHD